MKFGIFLAPFHRPEENPTLALERDMQLIEHLDRLGFDEAWVGEHHSGGWEIIANPMAFIAMAAARTRRINLGTGVVSIPYHHPFIVADTMVMLDHLTRGRAMLGVGPGALSPDAYQMGGEPLHGRRRMAEGLEAIMALLEAKEPVTMKTDWFEMREARLQLASFTKPHLPVTVANVLSPAGAVTAGKNGVGLLSIGAWMPGGLVGLDQTWRWTEEAAAGAGKSVSREDWRLVIQMHLADSREEALADVSETRLREQHDYWQGVLDNPKPKHPRMETIEFLSEKGAVIVGTPDDAIQSIENMIELSGGFGGLLTIAQEWAPREKRERSFELFARFVAPHFQGHAMTRIDNGTWIRENKAKMFRGTDVQRKAFDDAGIAVPEGVEKQWEWADLARGRNRV
jgi:limonene 1,2-monooxygenase